MATLRDIKRRITSVKNTSQITKAMKLVAAAKMRRAQENVLASRPYSEKLLEVLCSLSVRSEESAHPLLAKREEKNILILLCSSDKGLCGAFNANLFRATMNLIHESEGKGKRRKGYISVGYRQKRTRFLQVQESNDSQFVCGLHKKT